VCLALDTGAYFLRLRVMSHAAKTEHGGDDRRFFVEEQLACGAAQHVAPHHSWKVRRQADRSDRRASALRRRRNDRGPCVAARSLATVIR
jgi:hypothetical protein